MPTLRQLYFVAYVPGTGLACTIAELFGGRLIKKRTATAKRKRAPLTRKVVLARAMAIADRDGIAGLSMRTLASALGVEAMSLYNHVANKEDLLDGLIDLVYGEMQLPVNDDPWRAAVRSRALRAREVLMRHRWAVDLMDSRAVMGEAAMRYHDARIEILRRGGLSMAVISHTAALLDAYVFGFVLQEKSLPGAPPDEIEMMTQAMLEQFPEDSYPNLRAFAVEHVLKPGFHFGSQFEWGLDLILDGIATRAV